jgi:hypothetical protein
VPLMRLWAVSVSVDVDPEMSRVQTTTQDRRARRPWSSAVKPVVPIGPWQGFKARAAR